MEEIINSFHIEIRSILAQLVNFGIVFFILFKFAYKPLMKKMKERTDIIEKGLADAKQSQLVLENAKKTKEEEIFKAKKEAKKILEETQKMAEKNKEEMSLKAKEQAQTIVEEAKKQIQSEKEKMLIEVKSEVGQIVSLALEKVLKKEIDKEKDGKIIEEALKEIN